MFWEVAFSDGLMRRAKIRSWSEIAYSNSA